MTSGFLVGTLVGMAKTAESRTHKTSAWVPPKRAKGKAFTTLEINALKPGPRAYRLYGRDGLIIEVKPTGAKLWRWRYRRDNGKETMTSLGSYPAVSLAAATTRLADAMRARATGTDPIEEKQRAKAERSNTFESVARQWLAFTSPNRKPRSNAKIQRILESDVFPHFGDVPIAEITAKSALPVFERMVARGIVHTASTALSYCSAIADYAETEGLLEADPFRAIGKRMPAEQVKHFAAITDPRELAKLLRAIEIDGCDLITKSALKLSAMFFVRPAELRAMRWDAIQWHNNEWHLKSGEKKEKRDHIVPLCTQALAIIESLKPITGHGEFVLASRGGQRPMSENTLNVALDRMGFGKGIHTGHGFRSTARTILDEVLRFPADIIEHQLAHLVRGPLGDTYNRTTKIEDRRVMMQRWGDYLEGLSADNVVPFRKAVAG